MPISDSPRNRQMRSEPWLMTSLTAMVALLLLALAWLVPLETRNSRGEIRDMSALDVWREMLDNIPADAPLFLNAPILTIASLIALVASAFVIVAVGRPPSCRSDT